LAKVHPARAITGAGQTQRVCESPPLGSGMAAQPSRVGPRCRCEPARCVLRTGQAVSRVYPFSASNRPSQGGEGIECVTP
jgi:hypothetical protein